MRNRITRQRVRHGGHSHSTWKYNVPHSFGVIMPSRRIRIGPYGYDDAERAANTRTT